MYHRLPLCKDRGAFWEMLGEYVNTYVFVYLLKKLWKDNKKKQIKIVTYKGTGRGEKGMKTEVRALNGFMVLTWELCNCFAII